MIKNCVKRKLIITTFALLIFLFTLFFPTNKKEITNVTITYSEKTPSYIYPLNKDQLVIRSSIKIDSKDILKKAQEILEILTIGNDKAATLPSLFFPVIPKNTKIKALDIQDETIKINFSQEFYNTTAEMDEKMIESIVYSLTEIDGISKVMIFVEDKLLEQTPVSKKNLPPLLTRNIGINKVYDLTSLKNVSKTTAYYILKEEDMAYYVPVTLLNNSTQSKVEIVIERLKTKPNIKANLMSYLSASTELANYEILEEEVFLSFAPLLYEGIDDENLLEEVKYAITLSLQDTLNVTKVSFETK